MRRVRSRIAIVLVALLAGCGGGGLEGVLAWKTEPSVGAGRALGEVRNTTSHSLNLDTKSMRLLDDRGRKVAGRFAVGTGVLAAHSETSLRASWKSGKPVRIDYGAGTLALPSQ
jgi:hypothetical protein